LEPGLRHDIDVAPEQVLEPHLEPREIEQCPAWFQANKQIDIAVARLFTSCHRPEDPHVPRPAGSGCGLD
jgi:hypothetical protein